MESRLGTVWSITLGMMLGLLVAGGILLTLNQQHGEGIQLLPPPTPAPLIIYVSGAVEHPGIYELQPGSHVFQAVEAAGGMSATADGGGINLAALLNDGEQVHIPILHAKATTQVATNENDLPTNPLIIQENPPSLSLININQATAKELEALPGIGPALSQRIINYRSLNGPFSSIEAIQDVSGIGPAKYEQIKDLITIGTSP